MNLTKKIFGFLIVAVMLIGLLPAIQPSASAASTPVLVLCSTTAVNPVLDHILPYDDFGTGGPHTVSFEWKAVDIISNDPNDPGAACAGVAVVGTSPDNAESSIGYDTPYITGTSDWISESFTIDNVGTYNEYGVNYPGNILRFYMMKAKGELLIKNVVIKNAAGTVKYDLNTDTVVKQAVSNMQSIGMTECDLSELMVIDSENCPWTAGLFGTGNYAAYLGCYDESSNSGANLNTTISPPYSPNPFVLSGGDKIIPKSRVFAMHGYRNGKVVVSGEGTGFYHPSWDNYDLPVVTFNGSIQIFKKENEPVKSVTVIFGSDSEKETYDVSELGNLDPGTYTIQFGASQWSGVGSDGIQYAHSFQYAFKFIVPGKNTTSVSTTSAAATTTSVTTTAPTTSVTTAPNTTVPGTTLSTTVPTTAVPTTLSTPSLSTTMPTTAHSVTTTENEPTAQDTDPDNSWIFLTVIGVLSAALIGSTIFIIVALRRKK